MTPDDFKFKEQYDISDLRCIMKKLRAPDGCPWDREQDHHTIRNNFIEETYEVIDAIDRDDPIDLCEELGDVLLQVVFHSALEEEKGSFDFDAVCDGVCKKLIERHPHVFGNIVVSNTEQVLNNWDAIKQKSKHQSTYTDTLKSVPAAFPALMRASKIQKRASKAGYDFKSAEDALCKVDEETEELRGAIARQNPDEIAEEMGDLLFSVANVSRLLKLDAEQMLQNASDKFIKRFSAAESLAVENQIDMACADPKQLDLLWKKVKQDNV